MFYTASVLGGLKHKHLETSSLFETHVFLSFFPLQKINDGMHFLYCTHSYVLYSYIYTRQIVLIVQVQIEWKSRPDLLT